MRETRPPGRTHTIERELREEIRAENRRFIVQAIIALAAAFGVGIAIGALLP
jgi:hypothetical protein